MHCARAASLRRCPGGRKFFLLRRGKEVGIPNPLGLLAVTPNSWSVTGSSSFPVPIPEIRGGRSQARRVSGTGTHSVWCSSWNCCPRTNLDLTLSQGDSFAQLPSLWIPFPFPLLPDHICLGPLAVVRLSISVEEGDLAQFRTKARLGRVGKDSPVTETQDPVGTLPTQVLP